MRIIKWQKSSADPELADHELRVAKQQVGLVKLALVVRKFNVQRFELTVPGYEGEFLTHWSNQDSQWNQLKVQESGQSFFAIRTIRCHNCFIVWVVRHNDGVADDQFSQFYGTEAEVIEFYS